MILLALAFFVVWAVVTAAGVDLLVGLNVRLRIVISFFLVMFAVGAVAMVWFGERV